LKKKLESKAADFKSYTLAIDENNDATDMAPSVIFIRDIDNATGKVLCMVPLKDNT